jgi:uncharacterized protein (TIGR02453 family)
MNLLSKESFSFMADLWDNNNKAWFDQNRKRYEEHVREPMKTLAELLRYPVSTVLPELNGKPHISRINNDIRFTPNKPPYKEHVWISFSKSSGAYADIFVAIGRNGWCAGVGIGAPKRDSLDLWRSNLLAFQDIWRRYAKKIKLGEEVKIYIDNSYKKPLYPEIPDDLRQLIQAKDVWLVEEAKLDFKHSPDVDCFRAFCMVIPIYLFMEIPADKLTSRLKQLGSVIEPPSGDVKRVWDIL